MLLVGHRLRGVVGEIMAEYKDSNKIIKFLLDEKVLVRTQKEKDYILSTFCKNKIISICNQEEIKVMPTKPIFVRHEKPDLLFINDNKVLGIEHFEVDSAEKNKKGSEYRQKYTDKYFKSKRDEVFRKLETENMVLENESIKTRFSYKNLFENTESIFEDHYKNINDYNEEIKKINCLEKREINYIFVIEYNLIFPFFFQDDNNQTIYFYPHNDIAFIEYLKTKEKIKGIIYHFNSRSNDIPSENGFLLNDKDNLLDYTVNDKYVFDISKKKCFDIVPKIATAYFLNTK
jgi:hypothetical protein